MKTSLELVREAYPDLNEINNQFDYGPGDYDPLLNTIGQILLKVDDNDYQGDSRVLFIDGLKIGFLMFGWGSCSGCDSLLSCSNFNDIVELRDKLINQIIWFDNKDAARDYIKNKDWELDFSGHQEETKEFIKQANIVLSKKYSNFEEALQSLNDIQLRDINDDF